MKSSFDGLSLGLFGIWFPNIVTPPDWPVLIPGGLLLLLRDYRPYTHEYRISESCSSNESNEALALDYVAQTVSSISMIIE